MVHYLIHRANWLTVVGVVLAIIIATIMAAAVLLGHTPPAAATHSCSGVHIKPGNDLDAIVNSDPSTRATTFCVHAPSSGATYTINNSLKLRAGDRLIGQPGQVITRGPASYGVPPVKIRNGASLGTLIYALGPNVQLKWLDIAGAVTKYNRDGSVTQSGYGITMSGANAASQLAYLTVHDNQATGIASMNGHLLHSNLYANGTNPDTWGFSASAVKGVDEYEAAYNYVHDNPANGIWCDYRCSDAGAAMPNGFWVHHNLLVKNGRWGARYEFAPIVSDGVHSAQPTALIEYNEIHANGYKGSAFGGASMYDAQNTTFRNNVFGPKTIAGVSYGVNINRQAILFYDTGRTNRTDLWNGDAVGNTLGGETIIGCGKPDNVVYCANNR
jgi:hypothetical protein